MKVRDAHGRTWRVTRRWTPWRRRFRDVADPDAVVRRDPEPADARDPRQAW